VIWGHSDFDAELVEVSCFNIKVIVVGRPSAPGWVLAPHILVPSDGVFGRFDLAALRGCHTFNVCLFEKKCSICSTIWSAVRGLVMMDKVLNQTPVSLQGCQNSVSAPHRRPTVMGSIGNLVI
jgi:hypothetical protein